jgi:hypothetical protein
MTTIKNTFEAAKDYLNCLSNSELVSIHNKYCQSTNNSDDEIYTNDEEFFNTFFDGKVIEAVRAISYGEYNFNNEYVTFNGYANLESFDDPTSNVDIESIANDILENPENYDIELEEVFTIDSIDYEGSEEDAKEQYEEYKTEIENANDELEEGEEKEEILPFEEWVKDNITIAD